jgi:hypothetical protein
MNKWSTLISLLTLVIIFSYNNKAQSFDGEWTCDYATYDTSPDDNAIGQNCIDVAVISENTFVALSQREPSASVQSTNYLIGYSNADSANGRMGTHYGSRGDRQLWINGFDQVEMEQAMDIAAKDSYIFVANNDAERNILVFQLGADSVESAPYRLVTGADSLWAIHVDGQGRVYVASLKTDAPAEILVFNSIENDPAWQTSPFTTTPLQTITLPDTGSIRGITTNSEGTLLYVSNYTTKEIYCYVGSPESGYTLYDGFNLQFSDVKIADTGTDTLNPGPLGLTYLDGNNILAFAADISTIFSLSSVYYQYGKMFFVNPNTGELLDTIDVAQWNFDMTGSYSTRSGGNTPGNASGYTSTFNVDFDENGNIYSQSYNGWTVEKWSFSGELPNIPITITGIEKDEFSVPDNFSLNQNYPNPFNPTTTIEFSVPKESDVNLAVYNINGELVTTLINSQNFSQGTYKITFDASKLASGTYLYVLRSNDQQFTKKMTLIK